MRHDHTILKPGSSEAPCGLQTDPLSPHSGSSELDNELEALASEYMATQATSCNPSGGSGAGEVGGCWSGTAADEDRAGYFRSTPPQPTGGAVGSSAISQMDSKLSFGAGNCG